MPTTKVFARIVQETEYDFAKVKIEVRVLVWAPLWPRGETGRNALHLKRSTPEVNTVGSTPILATILRGS